MFALATPLQARLAAIPALAGWTVRDNSTMASRTGTPAVELVAEGASVADVRNTAALVEVRWGVSLIVLQGPAATALLDLAFAAVVESLHNYQPGAQGGRVWQPLRLQSVSQPEFAEQGQVQYRLLFVTSARYNGQP